MAGPTEGQVYDGYRFMGGDPADQSNWQQVAPIDVSAEWGAGARQLPNGTIERVGPRGGVTKVGDASADGETVAKLTEGQGKAMLYGSMMSGAEKDYQQARSEGYNPAGIRNQIANAAGVIPFDGDFFGRLIRDDVSDRGRQAELRWAEGNLRQLTGAAATTPEIERVAAINFDRGNDQLAEQRYRTRADTFRGTTYAAGPGGAVLGEYPGMPGDPGPLSENGLPSYPGIAKLTEGVRETPLPEGGYGAPDPTPGASPDQPFDFVGASREDTIAAIQRGGWFRQGPDGEPYQLPPSAPEFGQEEGDQRVSDGVYVRPQNTPEAAVADRRDDNGIFRRIDAGVRGAADAMTFGLSDEIAAAGDTLIGRGSYRENLDRQRAIDRADQQDVPVSRGAGQVAGAIAAPGAIASGKFVASAPKLRYAMTRGGAVGAGYGAAYGAGNAEGGLAERGQGALSGLMTGGLTGAALPPLARGVGMIASPLTRPAGNFIGETLQRFRGSPMTGVDRAARDLTQGVSLDDMEAQVANMRRFGAEPTIADAGGSVVQSRTRVAATRQTPGRQAAENFATGRRGEVQDFTQGLAQRVSPIEATPAQLDEALTAYQRDASRPAFDAVRGERVQLDPSSVMALRGEEGRSAIRQAARLFGSSVDEQERNVAAELNQLADTLLDQPNTEITVGAADLLSRYLGKAGGTDANAQRVFGAAGRAVRQNARDQVPAYGDALEGYAQRARLGDAVEIGDRFAGNKGHPADFVQAVEGMDPAQRQIAAAAGRAGLERAAGTGRGAPGVLDSIATDRNMQRKATALLGQEGADELRQGAGVGRQLMMTGQNVNPRAGSNTFLNSQDGEAQKAGNIVGNVLTGRFGEAIGGAIDLLKSRGMSDQQAETLISLATDPSRTDEVLSILRQRGFSQQESLRLVERMVPQLSGAAGAAQAPQQPRIRMAG
ncbi:hypothetical protein HNP32_003421 [Brevundimonas bullata]|uniref:Uncharacterized protein n=1 Tax=Brevundimonas bullata TaxID=13160 RepID=A0A7W7ISF3_9CAUL|nr:hypothetical protein [Brevundimonas bullata]MBB4799661.1 hypothetical protein [Brevundimonas bullata]MBB6384717.1 hypothetical protein [Brevundimonas bullata]